MIPTFIDTYNFLSFQIRKETTTLFTNTTQNVFVTHQSELSTIRQGSNLHFGSVQNIVDLLVANKNVSTYQTLFKLLIEGPAAILTVTADVSSCYCFSIQHHSNSKRYTRNKAT